VAVLPISDPPVISELPSITINAAEEETFNIEMYVHDVESAFSDLLVTTDHTQVTVDGSDLVIKFDEPGLYSVEITVNDGDSTATGVLEVTVIDPNDRDGDGLPNDWEELYGLDPDDAADAQIDLDNDMLTNLQEYAKDTDPNKYDTDFDGINDRLDEYPLDPNLPGTGEPSKSDDILAENIYLIVIIIIVVILLLGILSSMLAKTRMKQVQKPFDSDALIRQIRDEIIKGEYTKEAKISESKFWKTIEKEYKTGKISEETYQLMEEERQLQENNENDIENYELKTDD
jgi:hypothetical protein